MLWYEEFLSSSLKTASKAMTLAPPSVALVMKSAMTVRLHGHRP